ncbi:MAG: pyruvate dehydrogenase (acetyl-transferring) E1 component subunit alpha [Hyphomicrobiaceae bacterium]
MPLDRGNDTALPVIAQFEIRRRAYLSATGELTTPLPPFAVAPTALIPLYRAMTLLRTLDAKAVALQRTGRLGTYGVALGQEAVVIGTASAMEDRDVLFPTYRENGALLWRGVPVETILAYWSGDERGSAVTGHREDFPICITIGSQASHAAGVAYAFKLRQQARVALCCMGDGATSKGDIYEAMNMAALHKLPVVFLIDNNQWAISVPLKRQTATATLAQKAIASGMPGEQVDGNDIIAVHAGISDAIARARAGDGPTLIEAVTYRLGDHTTADDARRYRSDDDVKAHWQQEPIARLKRYLVAQGAWTKADEEALIATCQRQIDEGVERYFALPARPPASMFDHLYEQLPPSLQRQKDELERGLANG